MVVWGIDLGVRSFYAAGISPVRGTLDLRSVVLPTPKSVKNAPPDHRWLELRDLGLQFAELISPGDFVVIEEPPLAGARNIRTLLKLGQTAGALASASSAPALLVEVSTWKKAVVDHGSADKDHVARWLATHHPEWSAACQGDQNQVDATCVAIYGLGARRALAGGLDPLRQAMGRSR